MLPTCRSGKFAIRLPFIDDKIFATNRKRYFTVSETLRCDRNSCLIMVFLCLLLIAAREVRHEPFSLDCALYNRRDAGAHR